MGWVLHWSLEDRDWTWCLVGAVRGVDRCKYSEWGGVCRRGAYVGHGKTGLGHGA